MPGTWFDRRAAQARIQEIEKQLAALGQEREAIGQALGGPNSYLDGATGVELPVSLGTMTVGNGRKPGRRGPKPGPTMVELLVEAAKSNPVKGWTVGELLTEVGKKHPERAGAKNASAQVSALLAQEAGRKSPRFTASKVRGQRAKLYKLA